MNLMAVLLFISGAAYANQSRSGILCAPLLSHSNLLLGMAASSVGEANWAEAYLHLLNFVLEGIDEAKTDTFGHTERAQFKSRLLQKISTSTSSVNPLDELQDFPPRNITNFSPKLSTLTDSGQFEVITENLTDTDWQYIRQAAQEQLSQLQKIQTAQASAQPITREDFEDVSDANGNSRLHRMLLEGQLDEAMRLVSSSLISTRYVNRLNKKGQTVLDILDAWALEGTLAADMFTQLRLALLGKNARSSHEMSRLENQLLTAAREGEVLKIQELYDLGVNIFLSNNDLKKFLGRLVISWNEKNPISALHEAARAGQIESIKLLIALGANINSWNEKGLTPLMMAIKGKQKIEVIKALLVEDVDIEMRNVKMSSKRYKEEDVTSFLFATRHGRADVMQLLIDCGANVNATSLSNRNALHQLASAKNLSEALQLLLKLRSSNIFAYDLDSLDDLYETPLHRAVASGNLALTKALLALGTNPYIKNKSVPPMTPYSYLNGEYGRMNKERSAIRYVLLKYMAIWKARSMLSNLKAKLSQEEKP